MSKQSIINEVQNFLIQHLEYLLDGEGLDVNHAIQELKNVYLHIPNAGSKPLGIKNSQVSVNP